MTTLDNEITIENTPSTATLVTSKMIDVIAETTSETNTEEITVTTSNKPTITSSNLPSKTTGEQKITTAEPIMTTVKVPIITTAKEPMITTTKEIKETVGISTTPPESKPVETTTTTTQHTTTISLDIHTTLFTLVTTHAPLTLTNTITMNRANHYLAMVTCISVILFKFL